MIIPAVPAAIKSAQGFVPDLSVLSRILSFVPSFNMSEIIFLFVSASITATIIYVWMRVFHEPPHPAHAFGVALIANLQNFYLPFLLSYALPFLSAYLPAQIIFHLVPLLVWVALIRIFYSSLDFKHAIIIAVLSYGSYIFLQSTNLIGVLQAMLPV